MPCHKTPHIRAIHVIVAICIVCLKASAGLADAAFDPAARGTPLELRAMTQVDREQEEPDRKWFVLVGIINVYPRLEREELIQNVLDPAIRTVAPAYRGTKTFSDLRDDGLLWTPQIAVGRVLSRHFALSIHGGYGLAPGLRKNC